MASKAAKDRVKGAPARRGETPKAPERAEHPVYARDEIARVLAEREAWTREELADALERLPDRWALRRSGSRLVLGCAHWTPPRIESRGPGICGAAGALALASCAGRAAASAARARRSAVPSPGASSGAPAASGGGRGSFVVMLSSGAS